MTVSPQTPRLSEAAKGILALIATFTWWGLSMLYYHQIRHVPAYEVLAHRSVWTFVLFGTWIAFQGRTKELLALFHPKNPAKTLYWIVPAAFFVSFNWFLFILAIQTGRAIEASLAYYIFPLMAAGVGAVLFRERLCALQYVAMGIATIAVTTLTIGLGAAPWLSMVMAGTFVIYGAIKKIMNVGPTISMAAESALLAPFGVIFLIGAQLYGWGGSESQPAGVFGKDLSDTLWLMSAGIITGVPLILFSYAARRVSMTVLGLGQFYNSTIQLFISVFIFGEIFTPSHQIAIPLIWIAIVLYSLSALRAEKWRRSARSVLKREACL
jgi:chloramphenicol-sensitive protein RarD